MRISPFSLSITIARPALVEDGRIVAAAQEERFTRKKHVPAFRITRSPIA